MVQRNAADIKMTAIWGKFDADIKADEDADDAPIIPILKAIGDRRGEAEAVDQAEDGRDDEHLTVGGGTAIGHQSAEPDGERNEGFDPCTGVTDPAECDCTERDAVAEGEYEGATECLAERGGAEKHRQHKEAMIPAVG